MLLRRRWKAHSAVGQSLSKVKYLPNIPPIGVFFARLRLPIGPSRSAEIDLYRPGFLVQALAKFGAANAATQLLFHGRRWLASHSAYRDGSGLPVVRRRLRELGLKASAEAQQAAEESAASLLAREEGLRASKRKGKV